MRKLIPAFLLLVVFLYACMQPQAAIPQPSATPPEPTFTATITLTPSATTPPTATATSTMTPTATLIPTATWQVVGPGEVVAPILMYHHVDPEESASNRYNTTPEVFAAQMQALDDWLNKVPPGD